MKEPTAFGKILRKMRVDSSEVLGKMAARLGISQAYLSSIESGEKPVPADLSEKIASVYGLSEKEKDELENARVKTKGAVYVDFGENKNSSTGLEAAVLFARDFSRLTEDQLNKIRNLLKRFRRERLKGSASKREKDMDGE